MTYLLDFPQDILKEIMFCCKGKFLLHFILSCKGIYSLYDKEKHIINNLEFEYIYDDFCMIEMIRNYFESLSPGNIKAIGDILSTSLGSYHIAQHFDTCYKHFGVSKICKSDWRYVYSDNEKWSTPFFNIVPRGLPEYHKKLHYIFYKTNELLYHMLIKKRNIYDEKYILGCCLRMSGQNGYYYGKCITIKNDDGFVHIDDYYLNELHGSCYKGKYGPKDFLKFNKETLLTLTEKDIIEILKEDITVKEYNMGYLI